MKARYKNIATFIFPGFLENFVMISNDEQLIPCYELFATCELQNYHDSKCFQVVRQNVVIITPNAVEIDR